MSVLPSPSKSPETTHWFRSGLEFAMCGPSQSAQEKSLPVERHTRHLPAPAFQLAMSERPSPLKSPNTTFSFVAAPVPFQMRQRGVDVLL